jgi:hypothetical protein
LMQKGMLNLFKEESDLNKKNPLPCCDFSKESTWRESIV